MSIHAAIKQIAHVLQVDETAITHIEPTPGGLTNQSYFVTINDVEYVIRIPGIGTDELILDKNEKENMLIAIELGIHPPLIYFDETTGFKITKRIPNASSITTAQVREQKIMLQVITLFKSLHQSTTPFKNKFDLLAYMKHYEHIVRHVNKRQSNKLLAYKPKIMQLLSVYSSLPVKMVPCHIDAAPSNILYSKEQNKLYLIDWEYSGMFDPFWDIATIFMRLHLTEKEQRLFLKHYLGRHPSQEEMLRLLLHSIFQDYLWGYWSLYKEGKGEESVSDFPIRYQRLKENLAMYDQRFTENIVS